MSQPTDDELRELVKTSNSFAEIYRKCGYSRHNKKLKKRIEKLDISHFKSDKFKGIQPTEQELKELVKNSISLNDVSRKCGYTKKNDTINKRIKDLKLDISHFTNTKHEQISDDEFIEIVKNSKSIRNAHFNCGYTSDNISIEFKNKIKKLNIDTTHFNQTKLESISEQQFKQTVENSNSISDLCKKLGYKNRSNLLKKKLKISQLDISHFNKRLIDKISDEEFEEIISNSIFYYEIYNKMGYNNKTNNSDFLINKEIRKKAKQLNICMEHIGIVKDYELNRHSFETMNRDLAWILGLIFSDGSLSKGNEVRITSIDYIILKKVENILEGRKLIYKRKKVENCKQAWDLYFCSKNISTILKEKYELHPSKSLTITWPKNLEKDFYWDFIRGVFDGDGCIYTGQQKNSIKVAFKICSASEIFIRQLKDKLEFLGVNNIYINSNYDLRYDSYIYCISIQKLDAIPYLYEKLYYNTDSYLPRKKIKMEKYLKNMGYN